MSIATGDFPAKADGLPILRPTSPLLRRAASA